MTPEEAILSVIAERGPTKSICPSEAARRLDPDSWRSSMQAVRRAGRALADEGRLLVTRKGEPVDPHTVKGVIRYRLP